MSLTLHNISLSWPHQPLLDCFSLTIEQGEIATIQGPSGCGKSTLLSAIAGTSSSDLTVNGTIYLNGTAVTNLPPEQRRIGILFQDALLFPHLSVSQNLGFGLPPHLSVKDRQKAIDKALCDCGLASYGAYDPAHLSGGQKARIAMMRAMLSEPNALLMDESFASLDPELRSQFGQFVSDQIRQKQIPALLISHHEDDKIFATGQHIKWPSMP